MALQFAKVSKCFKPTKEKVGKIQKKRNIINYLTLFVTIPIRYMLFLRKDCRKDTEYGQPNPEHRSLSSFVK